MAIKAAYLLAKETDKRIEIFHQVYTFYNARSNIAHGSKGKRQRTGEKKTTDLEEAADLGFVLASKSLRALLEYGEFPEMEGANNVALEDRGGFGAMGVRAALPSAVD